MSDQGNRPSTELEAPATAQDRLVQAVNKIVLRPTEKIASYARRGQQMLEKVRDDLVRMEAEHNLAIEDLAARGQSKIEGVEAKIASLQAEVEAAKLELVAIKDEWAGKAAQVVAEFERQHTAQNLLVTMHQNMVDTLSKPLINQPKVTG